MFFQLRSMDNVCVLTQLPGLQTSAPSRGDKGCPLTRTPLISREEQLLGVRELGEHLPLTASQPGCRSVELKAVGFTNANLVLCSVE